MAALCRPHVVILPLPNAQGHINPMMQLAKTLAARGVLATFITIEYSIARLLRAGLGRRNPLKQSEGALCRRNVGSVVDVDQSVRLIGVPDGLPAESDRHVLSEEYVGMLERLAVETEEQLKKLMEDPHVPPITCVVADVFLDSVRAIAKKLKLPLCYFWPQSATVLSIHTLYDSFKSNGYDPLEREVPPFSPKDASEDAFVTCIPGVSKLHKVYLPYYLGLGDIGLKSMIEWMKNTINHLDESICVLGNTCKELELEQCALLGTKFFPIGPLMPPAFLGESNKVQERQEEQGSGANFWNEEYKSCMDWLDKQPNFSVVYVSFGSLVRFSKAQILGIAEGLIRSKHRFLWVLRKDVIIGGIPNVSEALPLNFFEVTKEQGKVVNWAPQMAILSHKVVGGFFSHCGWNSLLESIVMGVPILAWPQIFDQVTNCGMLVHEWKLGLELKLNFNNQPEPKDIAQDIINLMEGPKSQEMRDKALSLRKLCMKEMLETIGSSHKNLTMFTDLLYKMASKTSLEIDGQ